MRGRNNVKTTIAAGVAGALTTAAGADIFTNYNLVVREHLNSTSQVAGRTAVGGNLTGSSSSHGTALTPSQNYLGVDVLMVGGTTSVQNINMQAGNFRYGDNRNGNVNHNGGGSTIFDASVASTVMHFGQQMENAATMLSGLMATANVALPTNQPAGVNFNAVAGANGVAVFHVNGNDLFNNNRVQQMSLALNGATSVIINVSGNGINWTNGNIVGGFNTDDARSRVLWNFYEAEEIHFGSRSLSGAVLAPYAHTTIMGQMNGSMWVESMTQRAMVTGPGYTGAIPATGSGVVLVASLFCMSRRRRLRVAVQKTAPMAWNAR